MTRKKIVIHVGRGGEVSGGMSQVMNGIMNWNFQVVQPELAQTRDGGSRIRELKLTARALRRVLFGIKPHCVVVHLSQGGSFLREGLFTWVAALRGVRVVVHLHGSSFKKFAIRNPVLCRAVFCRTDASIVLSDESATAVRSISSATEVALIPNTVGQTDARSLSVHHRDQVIVFAGVVSHRKGCDLLFDAWRRVGAVGWELVVAGPIASDFLMPELPPSVSLMGSVSNSSLHALLGRSSIAILPSRAEAMPVFILEAMKFENAVISTRVGGVAEMLGSTGIVNEPGDGAALERSLSALIADRDLRVSLAVRAKKRFEDEFSAEKIYTAMEDVWLGASVK